jgi:para-aminobenzoate synthetase component 1
VTRFSVEYRTKTQCVALLLEERPLAGEFFRYFELHRGDPYAFLLDSASPLPGLGRYSLLGGAPWLVYRARRGARDDGLADVELSYWDADRPDGPPRVVHRRADAFADLERQLAELAMPQALRARLPLPFVGGALGYVSYDANRFLEALPDLAQRDLDIPEICLMFVGQLLAHDHETGGTQLISSGRGATAAEALAAAESSHARYQARLAAFEINASQAALESEVRRAASDPVAVHAHASPADYAQTVQRAREHIFAGDVFEVCTTHRLDAAFSGDGWDLYQSLRQINPAPFASYLQYPDLCVVSSSPERFLRLTADGQAESRPIKGTRPRGATPGEDAQLRAELLASEKDRAENIMIVDLVRNDFGRVCEVDSIEVPELMCVEQHPSVFQMVSTVRGCLAKSSSPLALFRACFPPGSMTGAPKIEAMKIIEALEPYKRGIYSGSIGYFDVGGGMDWSVVIRSFVLVGGRCYFGVGGAVVADSDPHAEYLESMHKAQALLAALALHAGSGSR